MNYMDGISLLTSNNVSNNISIFDSSSRNLIREVCLSEASSLPSGIVLVNLDSEPLSVVREMTAQNPDIDIVLLASQGQEDSVAEGLQSGAIDYLLKPVSEASLQEILERISRYSCPNIVAKSWRTKQLLQLAYRVASSDATALIQGESGTGKEVIARYIHNNSAHAAGPFVAINCAAIPETMVEATLFGHEKGAFTGAVQSQSGKFEEANGGTIFLDEIGELTPAVQAKLLRVIQEREVQRVGSHKTINLKLRVVAATNINLQKAVEDGRFREDLYFRLAVLPLTIPPLRDRVEDILPLARFIASSLGEEQLEFTGAAQSALNNYSFPGNVRELENIIQRALLMRHGAQVDAVDLMLPNLESAPDTQEGEEDLALYGKVEGKKRAEYDYVINVIRSCNGNRSRSAEKLGISTRALRYKLTAMKDAGVDLDTLLAKVA